MLPTVALVGRPNVGKSTLFNRLTKSRNALVADFPGLTRDRQYGKGRVDEREFVVIDTGGFEPVAKEGILKEMARQTLQALDEADVVIFIVDGRAGVTPQDARIASMLRKRGRPVYLAVNKTEGMQEARVTAEFFELGIGTPYAISAAHGERVNALLEFALEELDAKNAPLPPASADDETEEFGDTDALDASADAAALEDPEKRIATPPQRPKIAIVGHPNVGKSTLVNALLGEERVIAFDEPGTTRDSIYLDFTHNNRDYVLIDTAGVRKRGKVTETIEKFSVIKTLQAIDDCNVVIFMVDATLGVSDHDVQLAGFVQEAGRALVVCLNKWDAADAEARKRLRDDCERKLYFVDYAETLTISARTKQGLDKVMTAVNRALGSAFKKLSTPQLTRALEDAVVKQQPPRVGTVRPKMRYAHQGGSNPPIIVIHGNAIDRLQATYLRYLERHFLDAFELKGTPLRLEMRVGRNPYAEETGVKRNANGSLKRR
ncbi:MAG: ribosome biogenesis GTPase Der [Betaproteobacteria bacterium]|nr:MAG: ribosome biogenesis GTPase Der [Betaproteobacteria bacterium]